ncbi:MAG: 2-oxoacid:acceptor oxidoreductase family protein [candidate division NC10 bacterium]|nr:2-oxoacid:acceptor oxidoreductase family protein [candidate division NC10 bacterium]MBI3080759.1 2-oxoacid:acceptor oxidoreductase family protein [candidate division NC10 bacterium]
MKELRFHGRREPRYDHVAPFVAAPRLLAEAALREGKHVQFRPPWLFLRGFTPETALLRVDREPIETYQQESVLDAVIVTDPTVMSEVNVVTGLKPGGLLLVNSAGSVALPDKARVITRDLSGIAKAHKAELTPALLGAVIGLTELVRLETAEELLKGAEGRDRVIRANLAALHAGFENSRAK